MLNAWVRALTALARVTRSVRITSTIPDLAFGIAVEVWPRTARAICSASRRSDLPSMRRASRLGRFTSTTRSPALVSALVRGGTEGSGAFDTDRTDLTVSAHPGQQPVVAAVGGGELLVTERPAMLVECGCVVGVLVGVDTADDSDGFGCHAGFAPPLGLI